MKEKKRKDLVYQENLLQGLFDRFLLTLSEKAYPKLSQREQAVLFQVLCGKTACEIGHFFGRSYRTIESQIARIKKKLGCHTKSELLHLMFNLD